MTMGHSYEETPSRLWYLMQYAKAFATTPFKTATRPLVVTTGKRTIGSVISLALLKAAMVYIVPLIPTFTFIPVVIGVVGGGAGLFFAAAAVKSVFDLKKSPTVRNFISARKTKWLTGPRLGARINSRLAQVAAYVSFVVATAGFTVGTAAALQYFGVISGAAIASLAAVASLPVMIGVAAAAIPLGIAAGILCSNKSYRLVGETPPSIVQAVVSRLPGRIGSMKSVGEGFTTAVARKAVAMTQRQIENAAARVARRPG